MNVPDAERAVLVGQLSSKHKDMLPVVVEVDRVYRLADPTLGSHYPRLRVMFGWDGQQFYLDYFTHSDEASSHRRIHMDGSVTKLENYEGQFGIRQFSDPAETAREDQRIAAHNSHVAEVLRRKGFED
jgi:hypothetical protein